MMTSVPRRALVFHVAGAQVVLRPGGLVLFGGIAAVLDITYLPLALPGLPAPSYHVVAVAMALLMAAATLAHECGHAVAYRLQGIWPVRITLRGSGGACADVVFDDTPARALVRALAGPAATALVILSLVAMWRLAPLPPVARLMASTLAVFAAFDLVFNTLPVIYGCDGMFALRAVLWLLRGREPEKFALLYLWRPVVLAAAALALAQAAVASHVALSAIALPTLAAYVALALCAVPVAAMLWRYATLHRCVGASLPL